MVAGELEKTGGFDLDFSRSSDGLDVKSGWGWGGKCQRWLPLYEGLHVPFFALSPEPTLNPFPHQPSIHLALEFSKDGMRHKHIYSPLWSWNIHMKGVKN